MRAIQVGTRYYITAEEIDRYNREGAYKAGGDSNESPFSHIPQLPDPSNVDHGDGSGPMYDDDYDY